jgi:hypothetical protein
VKHSSIRLLQRLGTYLSGSDWGEAAHGITQADLPFLIWPNYTGWPHIHYLANPSQNQNSYRRFMKWKGVRGATWNRRTP